MRNQSQGNSERGLYYMEPRNLCRPPARPPARLPSLPPARRDGTCEKQSMLCRTFAPALRTLLQIILISLLSREQQQNAPAAAAAARMLG